MHKTTVRIRDDQHEFVQDHDSIDLSGVTRDALDDLMEAHDE